MSFVILIYALDLESSHAHHPGVLHVLDVVEEAAPDLLDALVDAVLREPSARGWGHSGLTSPKCPVLRLVTSQRLFRLFLNFCAGLVNRARSPRRAHLHGVEAQRVDQARAVLVGVAVGVVDGVVQLVVAKEMPEHLFAQSGAVARGALGAGVVADGDVGRVLVAGVRLHVARQLARQRDGVVELEPAVLAQRAHRDAVAHYRRVVLDHGVQRVLFERFACVCVAQVQDLLALPALVVGAEDVLRAQSRRGHRARTSARNMHRGLVTTDACQNVK